MGVCKYRNFSGGVQNPEHMSRSELLVGVCKILNICPGVSIKSGSGESRKKSGSEPRKKSYKPLKVHQKSGSGDTIAEQSWSMPGLAFGQGEFVRVEGVEGSMVNIENRSRHQKSTWNPSKPSKIHYNPPKYRNFSGGVQNPEHMWAKKYRNFSGSE